ncbi:MAG: hypothetical protein CM15mV132_330 [uncultured marine virus]|nr:MAG: hypothetical protein CM15mV132_330 [uncultured marine virus]
MCFFNTETYEIKKNLVLLGMMGSGKSSIGSIISKKLNINFIDIDKEIKKIRNENLIFLEKREKNFSGFEKISFIFKKKK